jgi:predicted DCC family thiol-disulfide oxidoreductase YuxK
MTARPHHIVFYDGVCGLCHRAVRFLVKRDRHDRLRYAPLQGPVAATLLPPLGGRPDDLDTMYVLTRDGRLLRKSRAILFSAIALGGAWRLLALLWVIPPVVMDLLYNLVARTRYRLFGKLEACELPTPEERARFLEASVADY